MTYVYRSHPSRLPLGPYGQLLEELTEARRQGRPVSERIAIIARYRSLWGCADETPPLCSRGPGCIDCFLRRLLSEDY